jgi:hypothetical protein
MKYGYDQRMISRSRGCHIHTFTDFSDGALFGPEVRSSLVETHTTGLSNLNEKMHPHDLSFPDSIRVA